MSNGSRPAAGLLCTLLGFAAGYNRNIPLHRQWMARSYAFAFIFVVSRVPDAFPGWVNVQDDRQLSTMLWSLVVLALDRRRTCC